MKKTMVETWGELGAIPGAAEIMPREAEVAGELKAEGVIESIYVKEGAKGAYIICADMERAELEARLKRLPLYPYFTKIEYTPVEAFRGEA